MNCSEQKEEEECYKEIHQGSEGPEEGRKNSAGGLSSHAPLEESAGTHSMAERAELRSQRRVDLKLSFPAYQKVP